MKDYTILVIDDEQTQREVLTGYLKKKGYRLLSAESGEEGISLIKQNAVDIVLSDFKMPDKTGIEVLKDVKQINPGISFVIITAYSTVEDAVKAMRLGAYDYISKPVDLDELDLMIEKILETRNLKSEIKNLKSQLQERHRITSIISHSQKMEEVLSIASRAAESNTSILITGENGTGKEVLAKAIHYISQRKDGPFVAVNIPALSENLLESELFGHEKGSFTGADRMRKGRFEISEGGTIFLDEIGDIPPAMQVKLLRVLQEREIERVGGTDKIPVDVRIISATNRSLEQKIKEGTFREDLYYRLNIVTIGIPPLRERKDDIVPLTELFVKKYSEQNNKSGMEISKESVDYLLKYNFPGNVRELENIIERAVVLSRGNLITVADLPMNVRGFKEEIAGGSTQGDTLNEKTEALEKEMIYDALTKMNGNQTKAGKLLGITERNLRYKMKKYGIKFLK
jgi:DNA-binding NtrC family response regulator